MNSDLDLERQRASFSSKQMNWLLQGGKDRVAQMDQIREIVQTDAEIAKGSGCERLFMSREQLFARGYRCAARMEQLKQTHQWDEIEQMIAANALNETLPTSLHGVFSACVLSQASDEQLAVWRPLIERKVMIGAYAQTELSHGSNVQGLQTTFTFIPESDEFEVHSPTLESMKWWPGCLGKTANHAVVFGRLIVNRKDFGVCPFLVQIRDYRNHLPLAGVEVGDIGPKYGTNMNDNGFLRFSHVRIPRANMLMRHSRLDRDGTFTKPPHEKVSYSTMVRVRSGIVLSSGSYLARAVTIAIRYSVQRRQFTLANDTREAPILDYVSQQYRLIPLIATSYAMYFTGRRMIELYMSMTVGMESGDMSLLPLVHVTSAGLKSYISNLAAEGIEQCRQCCGGHGYSRLSGLPDLFADFLPLQAAEGDNYILTQQVGRYLIKALTKAQQGDSSLAVGSIQHYTHTQQVLSDKCQFTNADQLLDINFLVAAHRHRATVLLERTANKLKEASANLSPALAWNSVLVEVASLSAAHCLYTMVDDFAQFVLKYEAKAKDDRIPLLNVLKRLCQLFGLYFMEKHSGDWLESGFLTAQHAAAIRQHVRQLLTQLRPDVIGLTDAFNFTDFDLRSALGCYDGKVYERLYEWAKKEPLNHKPLADGFEQHLQPIIHQGLRELLPSAL